MNMKNSTLISLLIILFGIALNTIIISCEEKNNTEGSNTSVANKGHELSEDLGASMNAYLMPGMDHGLMQSPINILSQEAEEGGKHNITFNFSGDINKVENLGHTVQLDFEPGNTITADGNTYEFKQLHFHTPSEHLIDGVTYPMEMHVVNVIPSQHDDDPPQYLVIAFLIKMGEENPFIKQFIDKIPEGMDQVAEVNLDAIRASPLMQKDPSELLNACYHYMGSLTTPPYTESVFWLVHKKIFEASPEQIMRINEIEGDNARHIQAINKRKVDSE